MTIKGYPRKGDRWNNLDSSRDALDDVINQEVGSLGRDKGDQSRSYNDRVQDAAEAYAWPDDIDFAPDFGTVEGFRLRMHQLAAFKAGVAWKERN